MSNPHLVTAAHNIRRAIRDVDKQIHDTRADIDRQIRELERKINGLKQDERRLVVVATQADSDMERARNQSLVQQRAQEITEVNRQIFTLNDDFRKAQADLEKQKFEFEEMARMLESKS